MQNPLSKEMILLLHKMLLTNIRDTVAGRFRMGDEMVRVGNHIGIPTEFESIHPFLDGNGRIGRVLNNCLLIREGFPPIIVRSKEKETYYNALRVYDNLHNFKPMIRVVELAILESLHKRLAYLEGLPIVPLTEYATTQKRSFHTLLNSSRRQTIPAFREKGVWKIGMRK